MPDEPIKTITEITDLVPDDHNANLGTERGEYMLETSLRRFGAGRGIVVDKNGKIIGGNKTLQKAAELGLGIRVVQTDGKDLVITQRTDLDLDHDPEARALAFADNRVAEADLLFDAEVLAADFASGKYGLEDFWRAEEIDALLADADAAERDMAESEEAGDGGDKSPQAIIHYDIVFDEAEQQERFYAFLKWLKKRYAEAETVAQRLDRFLVWLEDVMASGEMGDMQ